jgi:hypothetical protein
MSRWAREGRPTKASRARVVLRLVEGSQTLGALPEDRLVLDCVAPVDRLGLVANDRHRGGAGHAGALGFLTAVRRKSWGDAAEDRGHRPGDCSQTAVMLTIP